MICHNGYPVVISVSASGVSPAIAWSNGDTSLTTQYSQTGTYWVEVTDGCGNSSVDSFGISLVTPPLLQSIPDTVVCSGKLPLLYSVITDAFFPSVVWSNDGTNQNVSYSEGGTHWVTVTDGCGNMVTDTFKIEVSEYSADIYIPNTFTPNKDGVNETFAVVGAESEGFEFMVFNRWGQMIFHTNSPAEEWHGTYGSEETVPEGVYVWKVFYTTSCLNPSDRVRIGHVNVIR
jgi:gliding motility-associated-like protein